MTMLKRMTWCILVTRSQMHPSRTIYVNGPSACWPGGWNLEVNTDVSGPSMRIERLRYRYSTSSCWRAHRHTVQQDLLHLVFCQHQHSFVSVQINHADWAIDAMSYEVFLPELWVQLSLAWACEIHVLLSCSSICCVVFSLHICEICDPLLYWNV